VEQPGIFALCCCHPNPAASPSEISSAVDCQPGRTAVSDHLSAWEFQQQEPLLFPHQFLWLSRALCPPIQPNLEPRLSTPSRLDFSCFSRKPVAIPCTRRLPFLAHLGLVVLSQSSISDDALLLPHQRFVPLSLSLLSLSLSLSPIFRPRRIACTRSAASRGCSSALSVGVSCWAGRSAFSGPESEHHPAQRATADLRTLVDQSQTEAKTTSAHRPFCAHPCSVLSLLPQAVLHQPCRVPASGAPGYFPSLAAVPSAQCWAGAGPSFSLLLAAGSLALALGA
jgi:hypothetical protein